MCSVIKIDLIEIVNNKMNITEKKYPVEKEELKKSENLRKAIKKMDKDIFNSNFFKELRKYATKDIAEFFFKWELKCYHYYLDNNEFLKYKSPKYAEAITIAPHLLNQIIYYSTFSNDYKNKQINEERAFDLYVLYWNYIGKYNSSNNKYKKVDDPTIYILYGHMQEQAIFQNIARYYNRSSRCHYLLKNKEFPGGITLSGLIENVMHMNLKEYVDILNVLGALSFSGRNIFNEEILVESKGNSEKYMTVLENISLDYCQCRRADNYHIFRVRPVLKSGKCYMIPSYCVFMNYVADNLYWILKNYFRNQKSDAFLIEFGIIFENYIFNILNRQYGSNTSRIDKRNDEKRADILVKSENYVYIIEVKARVSKIDSKYEDLNLDSVDEFLETVNEAIEQIDSTAREYKGKRIIPMIVFYDPLYVEEVIVREIKKSSQPKNFSIDDLILIDVDCLEALLKNCKEIKDLDGAVYELLKGRNPGYGLNLRRIHFNIELDDDKIYPNLIDNIDYSSFDIDEN